MSVKINQYSQKRRIMKQSLFSRIFIIILLSIVLSSCRTPRPLQDMVAIDLNNLQQLPTPNTSELHPLKVAIAAVISPEGTIESYQPLLKYLEDNLERPVELVQRRTYADINGRRRQVQPSALSVEIQAEKRSNPAIAKLKTV